MNQLFAAAADVLGFCGAQGWAACAIGGLAVQRWGEPRQTRDVDVALMAGYGGEAAIVDVLLTTYAPRIQNARAFALEHRVVLVSASGVPIDISLAALPFEARVMDRASAMMVGGLPITTCSAEDLIVMKAFAGRPQDWLDVEGIVARQGARLDRALILEELEPLLTVAADTGAAQRLQTLFIKHPA